MPYPPVDHGSGSKYNPLRARTLIPPGAFNPVRIQSRSARSGRHFRLAIPEGISLFDGISQALAHHQVASASMTLLGSRFSYIEYCTAPPDPRQQTIVRYTSAIPLHQAYMVFGNATLGKSAAGEPLIHCHAAVTDEYGTPYGGHILTQNAIVGPGGVSILVLSLDNFELRVAFDPETNQSLLQPHDIEPAGQPAQARNA
ncbi:PPC domain-containing DNA-binding protein [Kerstersia gyiorum]|uniref:PPC domain-containing DNA-binding protein n=1 Tax=Kerstersia gyiorum TaxID=206506 RepID=UPI0020968EB6|nr:DUF296 domain-containing protein [Kerstersia gyiorum]MCO7640835.1 hypothetical protein [Pseudomonas sp. S 311-6]MCP1632751.1 putative DNA-binding protein with PD1-like motif [Kerstersia gyiorum]MCP1635718.1 putative DNA-binding protein with PD1-like motif [Kerstersia gyiorum]MCP1670875.1 putative DNA-binding protein with PD1-like motif [Kerstersia gyiorum]MCP1678471.1 putative DNA-binding protein with PD1-like motif [Kerstersia gyiorum]